MTDPTKLVNEFHKFFGLPTPNGPRVLEGKECYFRDALLTEEYLELHDELHREPGNLAAQYKEAADLAYVLYGWDQHAGGALSAVLEEVHRSNMTKLWECWDCDGTGEIPVGVELDFDSGMYDAADIEDCVGCQGTGRRAKYREDGKVLKPPTYEPPDIQKVLDEFFVADRQS